MTTDNSLRKNSSPNAIINRKLARKGVAVLRQSVRPSLQRTKSNRQKEKSE